MRFVERFLILLALIALGLRLIHSKDGPTLELISFPLLAAFYLFATPLSLLKEKIEGTIAFWTFILLSILCGAGFAYCIISLMFYTLGWLPRFDMLENCGLILLILSVALIILFRKKRSTDIQNFLLRMGVLVVIILIASLLHFAKN